MVVKVYRVSSGFRNVSDAVVLGRPGSDIDFTEVYLELPEGFTVDESQYGSQHIYDAQGYDWEPVVVESCNIYQLVGERGFITVREVLDPAQPKIKTMRENAGVSIRALAAAVGVSKTTIENAEAGNSTPSAEVIYKIARALNCAMDELWG